MLHRHGCNRCPPVHCAALLPTASGQLSFSRQPPTAAMLACFEKNAVSGDSTLPRSPRHFIGRRAGVNDCPHTLNECLVISRRQWGARDWRAGRRRGRGRWRRGLQSLQWNGSRQMAVSVTPGKHSCSAGMGKPHKWPQVDFCARPPAADLPAGKEAAVRVA